MSYGNKYYQEYRESPMGQLAVRAKGTRAWAWTPGMLGIMQESGHHVRIANDYFPYWGGARYDIGTLNYALPMLEDPATMGALLGWVRTLLKSPRASIVWGPANKCFLVREPLHAGVFDLCDSEQEVLVRILEGSS